MYLLTTKRVQQAQLTTFSTMKDRKTYKILTACSFILPINRWYLGNAKGAIGRSITVNYFLMGWLGDLFSMNKALDQGIAKRGFANTNIRNQLKGSDECNRLS